MENIRRLAPPSPRAGALGASLALGLAIAITIDARAASAQREQSGEEVQLTRPAADDVYLSGDRVEVRAPVEGDVVAAGRRVRIDAPVAGDALLAAETVVVDAPIGDDLRAAGRSVRVGADVQGHVAAAGETVVIEDARRVERAAWLAGQDVEVRGSVGSLRAAGERVTILGEVRGDARIDAESVRLGPGARVGGDLRYTAGEAPALAEGARIEGRLIEESAPGGADPMLAAFLGGLFWIVSFVLAAVLLQLAIPRASATVAAAARTRSAASIGLGLGVLLLTPIAIGIAFATWVLWLVGVALAIGYALALVIGALLGALVIARLGLDAATRGTPSRAKRVGAVALVAAALALLSLIPVAGWIVMLASAVLGIGAAALAAWRARSGRPLGGAPAPATPPEPAPTT